MKFPNDTGGPSDFASTAVAYLRMVKFSHTLFALPFALTSMVLAADGFPDFRTFFWICMAMVGARSGAMGFNRLADRFIDAANPRTAQREIPSGIISPASTAVFIVVSFAILILAAWRLNPLCFKLSPIAIAIVCFYSYTKRFTTYSHIVLGLAISSAPIGAWIAVLGRIDVGALLLGSAVMCWIAGFDILYSLQDQEFDTQHGLQSIPVRFGKARAIAISNRLHMATWGLLVLIWLWMDLGVCFLLGVGIAGFFLWKQHRIVQPDDLSRLDKAFFDMNAYLSIGLFAFTLLDRLIFR